MFKSVEDMISTLAMVGHDIVTDYHKIDEWDQNAIIEHCEAILAKLKGEDVKLK